MWILVKKWRKFSNKTVLCTFLFFLVESCSGFLTPNAHIFLEKILYLRSFSFPSLLKALCHLKCYANVSHEVCLQIQVEHLRSHSNVQQFQYIFYITQYYHSRRPFTAPKKTTSQKKKKNTRYRKASVGPKGKSWWNFYVLRKCIRVKILWCPVGTFVCLCAGTRKSDLHTFVWFYGSSWKHYARCYQLSTRRSEFL